MIDWWLYGGGVLLGLLLGWAVLVRRKFERRILLYWRTYSTHRYDCATQRQPTIGHRWYPHECDCGYNEANLDMETKL